MSHDHSQNHYGSNEAFDGYDSDLASAGILIESLRQQLSAALAACKVKDEALRESGRIYCTMIGNDFINQPSVFERTIVAKYVRGWFRHNQPSMVKNALAIQPDDSALKEWLGEPEWFYRKNADGVNVFYEDIEERPHGCKPLYSPKGLK